MRYREFAVPSGRPRAAAVPAIVKAVTAARTEWIPPEIGWPSGAGRTALRFKVECHGLTVHDLGGAFAGELQRRKGWCRERCRGAISVGPIRPDGGRRDTGRHFLFSDAADAAAFRRSWR